MTEPSAAAELQRLRQEIADLDRQVLSLAQRRMAIARQIGQHKQAAGLPVRDFRTEVEVLQRARETSGRLGLDADLGEALVRQLIEGAVRTQHTAAAGERGANATPQRILVLGGAGRMGSWLSSFFHAQGHEVRVFDPGAAADAFPAVTDMAQGVQEADVVVLSTPIGDSDRVLRDVLSVQSSALIFDICSLKSPLLGTIGEAVANHRNICSVHPMFAPGAVLLSGRVLLVCDCGVPAATQAARSLFEGTALRLVDLSVQEHDRLMGVVLGLSHAVNIAFASALEKIGLPYQDLDRTSSTTFGRQIRTTAEVVAENPRLYYEIQHFNRHTPEMLQALQDALQRLAQAATASDSTQFLSLMEEGHAFFAARPPEVGTRIVG